MYSSIIDEIKSKYIEMVNVYFVERNIDKTILYYDDDVLAVDSFNYIIAKNKVELYKFFCSVVEDFKIDYRVEYDNIYVEKIDENVYSLVSQIVIESQNISMKIQDQVFEFTVIYTKGQFDFLIKQIHISSLPKYIKNRFYNFYENIKYAIDRLPGGILIFDIINSKIKIRYFNETVCKISGYSRTDYSELLFEKNMCDIHPDDRKFVFDNINKATAENKEINLTYRVLNRNTGFVWINLRAVCIKTRNSAKTYYGIYTDVNELKRKEQEIRIQSQKFDAALNDADVYLLEYTFLNNTVIPNKGFQKNFVVCDEESETPFLDRLKQILYSEDVYVFEKAYEDMMRGVNFVTVEVRLKNKNDSYEWYQAKFTTIFDDYNFPVCAICVFENINKQKLKEVQYKQQIEMLQKLCEYTIQNEYSDLILVDIETRSAYVYRYDGVSSTGRYVEEYDSIVYNQTGFISRADIERFKLNVLLDNMIDCMENSPDGTNTCIFRKIDLLGCTRVMELKSVYFEKDRKKIIVTIRDIQDEILEEKRRSEKPEKALRDAEKAAFAKKEFLSHMSHEIKTPLNGIKGMLELLAEQPDMQNNEYLEKAIISTNHLYFLINDVLDMSKIESGKMQLKAEIIYISEIIEYINSIMEPIADANKVTLKSNSDCPFFKYVYSDSDRIKQIIINLLSNAIKYNKEGGKAIYSISTRKKYDNKIELKIIVEDSGIGMSDEFLQTAFEPFAHENYENPNTGLGFGFGLAFTRKLVEFMGGKIFIESELGIGTKVFVSLETEFNERDEILKKKSRYDKVSYINFEGKRALIVEDNEINMEIAENQLNFFGLKTEKAFDGEEAVEIFENAPHGYFDIIFMDIMMPRMDGFQSAKLIKEFEKNCVKKIPIVAMTANAFDDDTNSSFKNYFDYHLPKPFERRNLFEILIQELLTDNVG